MTSKQPQIESGGNGGVPEPFGPQTATEDSLQYPDLTIQKKAALGAGPESESPPLAQTAPLPPLWAASDFGSGEDNNHHQAFASVSATAAWIQEPSPVGAIGDPSGEATVPSPGGPVPGPEHEPQATGSG